jgi:glyoxylase-like metal-dependent hydrolase (beta-lactamase superfamily II)
MLHENCFVAYDEESREAAIIDPGFYWPDEQQLLTEFIDKHRLKVKYLLCTHLHFDHIFGNAFVEETFGVKASANDADWPWAENIKERVARFGVRYDEDVPPLGKVLNDGDEITFGNNRIVAIAVPGHSPGSLAYHIPDAKMLFSGDALFRGSIGRTDFPDSNHRALIYAIREKLLTLPKGTIVYPGHDRETTIELEKMNNMYLR